MSARAMTLMPHRRWNLSREALEKLLQRLGSDPEAAAREYEVLRTRLLEFFEAKHAAFPEALADEAMDRVARKLEEGEVVRNLRAYLYGVAKHVWLEAVKRSVRERGAFQELRAHPSDQPSEAVEVRVDCLERCLRGLTEESRRLIVAYYAGPGASHLERRQRLAEELGISYTALKTRAHRIRTRLEECLHSCLEERNLGTDRQVRPLSVERTRPDEL